MIFLRFPSIFQHQNQHFSSAAPRDEVVENPYTFQRNSAALLSAQGSPLGTRVQGTAPFEVREKNFMKLLVLASTTL